MKTRTLTPSEARAIYADATAETLPLASLSAYSDENRHPFQSNVGHYFQRKPCHLFRLNHSQSFHSKVGH